MCNFLKRKFPDEFFFCLYKIIKARSKLPEVKSLIYKQIDFFYIIMYPIKESLNAGFMMEQEIQERNNFSEAEIQNADKIAQNDF